MAMLGDAIRNLKLDRRLAHRRGWIEESELQTALGELADAADKLAPEEAEPPPAPATDSPAEP
jgi:hypothetical protein